MKTELVIEHKPVFKKSYWIVKKHFDTTGYCYREDNLTWLQFATKQEAIQALKKELEAAE